jgi:hypothetical protein
MFCPEVEMEKFMARMRENKDHSSLSLSVSFARRADAYLLGGQFRRAVADYNRAVVSSGNGGQFIDRWRSIGKLGGVERFIDTKMIEFGQTAKVWLKTNKAKGSDLDSFELDCQAKKLRENSSVSYREDGKLTNSDSVTAPWRSVVPDSFGESLYEGLCMVD